LARFPAGFFARPSLTVAPELLGALLIHEGRGGRRVGRVVEVEAYLGDGSDPASHAHNGPTARNRSMFGPPGRFYVYRSMGLHYCVNVVCEARGRASAVLLRAVEPLEGIESLRRARGGRPDRELTNGPGKLAQAFGIDLGNDGQSALRGPLRLAAAREAPLQVLAGPRIGISKATTLPYRFHLAGHACVTRAPQNRQALPAARPG
jgi:DNA-3-methyladenine glycosylase